jgi:ribulose-phosphate 3-epimerase
MSAIIPAILPTSGDDLADKLLRLRGLVDEVQIDVVDGTFGGAPSWPYSHGRAEVGEETVMPYLGSMRFEADLLVDAPEAILDAWVGAGASRLTVHAETTRALPQLVRDLRGRFGHDKDFAPGLLSFGLSINVATDTTLIEPYLGDCDYVQFMGIARVGRQGEPFESRVVQKIAAFRAAHPDMPIQVDGGVTLESAPALLAAGVTRLVVGSALWARPDLPGTLAEFKRLLEPYGMRA